MMLSTAGLSLVQNALQEPDLLALSTSPPVPLDASTTPFPELASTLRSAGTLLAIALPKFGLALTGLHLLGAVASVVSGSMGIEAQSDVTKELGGLAKSVEELSMSARGKMTREDFGVGGFGSVGAFVAAYALWFAEKKSRESPILVFYPSNGIAFRFEQHRKECGVEFHCELFHDFDQLINRAKELRTSGRYDSSISITVLIPALDPLLLTWNDSSDIGDVGKVEIYGFTNLHGRNLVTFNVAQSIKARDVEITTHDITVLRYATYDPDQIAGFSRWRNSSSRLRLARKPSEVPVSVVFVVVSAFFRPRASGERRGDRPVLPAGFVAY